MKLTTEELLEWGFKEDKKRQTDMAGIKLAEDLEQVQAAAKQRRLLVGLTAGQAARAVHDAQNELARREKESIRGKGKKMKRRKRYRCPECGEMFSLKATTYERDDGYICNRCGDALLDDVNREILGDDADYFEAAGIRDIGYK